MDAEHQSIPAKSSRSSGLSRWMALSDRCRQYSGPTRTSIVNGGFRARRSLNDQSSRSATSLKLPLGFSHQLVALGRVQSPIS